MNRAINNLVALGIAIIVAAAALFTFGLSLAQPKTQPSPQEASQAQPQPDGVADATTNDGQSEAQPVDEAASAPSEKDEYVAAWAERIDAFNAGYPLEGYGATFAEAAYDQGVDPRLSPAIARVESGSGQNCMYEHNAWGWGNQSWPDWETAINEHVSGFAAGYGSTLSWDVAATYAPEETEEWYNQVASCMEQIWPSESM